MDYCPASWIQSHYTVLDRNAVAWTDQTLPKRADFSLSARLLEKVTLTVQKQLCQTSGPPESRPYIGKLVTSQHAISTVQASRRQLKLGQLGSVSHTLNWELYGSNGSRDTTRPKLARRLIVPQMRERRFPRL